jgi:SAM-dependent methyltransferase
MLIHYYLPIHTVIKDIIPDVDGRKVLDFGCNYGIFLETSNGSFPQENYTGIDICEDAIETGRRMFPGANFIHYDGFNPEYNPGGKEQLPVIEEKYDLIIAHSVFTHTSKEEMLTLIEWLYSHLAENGKMLISWTAYGKDTETVYGETGLLRFFPEHENMDYCYVYQCDVDGKTKSKITQEFPQENVRFLWTYYSVDYFSKMLDKYNKTTIISNDWRQDLVIITRD